MRWPSRKSTRRSFVARVVMVPCVSTLWRSRRPSGGNPLDTFTYDMNRIYPGKPDGYFSDRVADAHWQAMKDVADLEISIHSGGAHSFLDKAIFVDERAESVELAKAMGGRLGLYHVLTLPRRRQSAWPR